MEVNTNKQKPWFRERIPLIIILILLISGFLFLTSKMGVSFLPNPFEKPLNLVETKKLLTECKVKYINYGGLYKPGLLQKGPPPATITLVNDSTRTLSEFKSDSEYNQLIKDNKTRCGFEVLVVI